MYELIDKALAAGFFDAVWMDSVELECEPRLRELCNPEGCPKHGNNWVCPPGSGTLEECAEKVSRFGRGLIVRSLSEIEPSFDDFQSLSRRHNFRLRDFIEAHCSEGYEILALTSGGCVFCEKCAYPEPCLKPNVRMNSLSAYGIDVGKLCESAGLEYSFRPDRIYHVALILTK